MQNNINRAVQFQAFDAVKGLKDAFAIVEKNISLKKSYDDDFYGALNKKIKRLKVGDKVLINYYAFLEYMETIGIIYKIDYFSKCLWLKNVKINFEDIIDINYLEV